MDQEKLKLGLLLDSFDVPAWAYHSLERIVNLNNAQFLLIIINDPADTTGQGHGKTWIREQTALYRLFNDFDEKIFLDSQHASTCRNAEQLLAGIPIIKIKPTRVGDGNYFGSLEICKIQEYKLDILVKMGFGNLKGEILNTPKYGIWAYDRARNPPGFWELVEDQHETNSRLQILSNHVTGGKVLYTSCSSTYPFSPARNRDRSLWVSASFLPRQISLLWRLGEKEFFKQIEKYNHENTNLLQGHDHTVVSNLQTLKLAIKLFFRIFREALTRIFCLDTWYLLFDFNASALTSFSSFREIVPSKEHFWADPHIIQKKGEYYVFVEEYVYRTKKGHLSVIKLDENGNCTKPARILEKEYHLSYPFVFEWDNMYYMIPESSANRTIDLYECIEFPDQWKFKMNLMRDVSAVDTTLFFHDGKWWLFTGMTENAGASPEVELFLFFADKFLTSDWNPHPLNPIVSGAKSARPAGKIFIKGGKIFRPSQDCTAMYGHGFDLNEIRVLSETEYREETALSIRPQWSKKILGTHTYGESGTLKVIDVFTRRRKLL